MHGVTVADDSLRQQVDLAPGTEWVASWTDDELLATKGRVIGLNAFLSDGFMWHGDVDLLVHNSIVWLHNQDRDVVPWLAMTPLTGTVAVSGVHAVALALDSRQLVQAGDHSAIVKILSNDPDENPVTIPVTLHVVGPELTMATTEGYFGRLVTVPITLNTNALGVAATTFSIDYDTNCLEFDPADNDGDGIPDALALSLPAGFQASIQVDLTDTNGEIDLFIADAFPPLTTLTDGLLATLALTARCQPPTGAKIDTFVGFSTEPLATFSDVTGHTIPGSTNNGLVLTRRAIAGDCNRDDQVNAADTIACVLEIFDEDSNQWLDAPNGAFAGNPPGCDSNKDSTINAADLICTVLIIFNGPDACVVPQPLVNTATVAATLTLPTALPAQVGQPVAVPIDYIGNGNRTAAAIFTINFDSNGLRFDPTDSNGDEIPDAITFTLPDGFTPKVSFDAAHNQLQFTVADLQPPLATLRDGALATIHFIAQGNQPEPTTATATFAAEHPASLGADNGQNIPLQTTNGSVLITNSTDTEESSNKLYMPVIMN